MGDTDFTFNFNIVGFEVIENVTSPKILSLPKRSA